ncbi:MAG: HD domain-containing protein [Bacilli bacterium]
MKINSFMTELNCINDLNVRKSLEIMIEKIPDYFFRIEAASTGKYHPSYACGEGGLLRHTKAVVKIATELFGIYKFDNHKKDLIIMACVMHDSLKKGMEEAKYTLWEHPILASDFIRNNKSELLLSDEDIEFVCGCIASHMGRFNVSNYSDIVLPLPKTPEQKFVHMCDYLASRKVININFDENSNIMV